MLNIFEIFDFFEIFQSMLMNSQFNNIYFQIKYFLTKQKTRSSNEFNHQKKVEERQRQRKVIAHLMRTSKFINHDVIIKECLKVQFEK